MQANRFTIYDAMAKNGYFDSNPANTYSRDKTTGEPLYQGPVEFPKALFHPEGEERIVVQAELIVTPLGPKAVGEQREMIFQIVKNAAEEAALRAEGWLDHPAKAIAKRVELQIAANPGMTEKERAKLLATIPTISSDARIKALEQELEKHRGFAKAAEAPAGASPGAALQPLAKANALGARFGTESPNL